MARDARKKVTQRGLKLQTFTFSESDSKKTSSRYIGCIELNLKIFFEVARLQAFFSASLFPDVSSVRLTSGSFEC